MIIIYTSSIKFSPWKQYEGNNQWQWPVLVVAKCKKLSKLFIIKGKNSTKIFKNYLLPYGLYMSSPDKIQHLLSWLFVILLIKFATSMLVIFLWDQQVVVKRTRRCQLIIISWSLKQPSQDTLGSRYFYPLRVSFIKAEFHM